MWHHEIPERELERYRDIGFKRKTPSRDGAYRFDGEGSVSVGVQQSLQPIEVFNIIDDLRGAVEKHDGLDMIQVFESNAGKREVWAVALEYSWILVLREEGLSNAMTGLTCASLRLSYDVAYG